MVTGSYPQLVKRCLEKMEKTLEWGHFKGYSYHSGVPISLKVWVGAPYL